MVTAPGTSLVLHTGGGWGAGRINLGLLTPETTLWLLWLTKGLVTGGFGQRGCR